MTFNLKIGLTNNFITNSSYTEFLGLQWIILCLGKIILIYLWKN
jgi:hypothetical protein